MALISEQEIAAENGTWLTYPTHLDTVLRLTPPYKQEIDAYMKHLSFSID